MYIPITFEGALQKCLFASGGVEGYFISGSEQWKYHWFTGSGGTLDVQKGTIDNVQVYVIGGGGGGAKNNLYAGGGGGGGVDYLMNARLFAGQYTATVGGGGSGATVSTGGSGGGSSFTGNNISIVVSGGGGGAAGSSNRGGTSGNGFTGGLNQNSNGGGGGGAIAGGDNASDSKAGNGGSGNTFYIAETGFGFGCGGGGFALDTADTQGFSCNDVSYGAGANGTGGGDSNANNFGGGGGAGYSIGGDGGDGSIIIQYPIYDYCTNFFNETGSCGCVELTFDATYPLGFYPDRTGSYIYMPCGGNQFASGSLRAYMPLTLCAVSNSYYSQAVPAANDAFTTITAGFANGPQCLSASLAPTTCSVESFNAICPSKLVTLYTPSGSGTLGYVPTNATQHIVSNGSDNGVKYFCISDAGSFDNNLRYPQVLSGEFVSLIDGASCVNTALTASWNGVGTSVAYVSITFTQCNGSKTTVSVNRDATSGVTTRYITGLCIDKTAPITTTSVFPPTPTITVNSGSSCLSTYFDTASCGCVQPTTTTTTTSTTTTTTSTTTTTTTTIPPSGYVSGAAVIWDFGNGNSYPGSGSTVYDLSGNNITGSLVGSPTWTYANGGTLIFSSSLSQRINYKIAVSSSYTTMAIIKSNTSNWNAYQGFPNIRGDNGVIVTGENSGTKQYIGIIWNGATANVPLSYTPSNISSSFHNYGITDNGTNNRELWFDTGSVATNTTTYTRGNSAIINSYINYDSVNGSFGDMTIMGYLQYNRVLTPAEIETNYNIFVSRF